MPTATIHTEMSDVLIAPFRSPEAASYVSGRWRREIPMEQDL